MVHWWETPVPAALALLLANTKIFVCRSQKAAQEYLEDKRLVALSFLKSKLHERGTSLYAVVKEQITTEVKDFQLYFKGEILLDEKKRFYGPQKWELDGETRAFSSSTNQDKEIGNKVNLVFVLEAARKINHRLWLQNKNGYVKLPVSQKLGALSHVH
ncbi:Peroxiredoxin-like 2A, partial [Galemys pyrenaicus]